MPQIWTLLETVLTTRLKHSYAYILHVQGKNHLLFQGIAVIIEIVQILCQQYTKLRLQV